MKITAVDTAILRIPTRKPIALDFPHHSLVVAHIHTDEGVSGLGYTLAFGGGGVESIQAYLVTRLAPLLIGQDPLLVERLWERMYRADRGIKRQGIAAYALSALDIALWDIVGKAAGLPLYKLWGAVTDRVAAYGSGGWPSYSLDDLIGEAQAYVARGCRYYKMKIHNPDPRANRERVLAVKKAVGDGVRGGRPRHQYPGGHRREQLHALRVPRSHRAGRRPLPDARSLPRQRLQRDAQDRPLGRRPPARRLAARRARAIAAGGRGAEQRLPRGVDRLGARGPVRRDAGHAGRRLPHPRSAGARHGPGSRGREEVPRG